jgi:hypothetical protein
VPLSRVDSEREEMQLARDRVDRRMRGEAPTGAGEVDAPNGIERAIELERELTIAEREEAAAEGDHGGRGRRRRAVPIRRGSSLDETNCVERPLADPHVLP